MSGFSSETRGDWLAQIEAQMNVRTTIGEDGPELPTWINQADVLALVEIAKAARDVADHSWSSLDESMGTMIALRSALASLDSGAAEEDVPPQERKESYRGKE